MPISSPIAFEQLPATELRDQTVQIKGFAYPAQNGQWILSPDPQLKSCCAGAAAKADRQVFLMGNDASFPQAQAVVVEGILRITPEASIGRYALENTRLVENGRSIPWLTLGLFLFITVALAALYRRLTQTPS